MFGRKMLFSEQWWENFNEVGGNIVPSLVFPTHLYSIMNRKHANMKESSSVVCVFIIIEYYTSEVMLCEHLSKTCLCIP